MMYRVTETEQGSHTEPGSGIARVKHSQGQAQPGSDTAKVRHSQGQTQPGAGIARVRHSQGQAHSQGHYFRKDDATYHNFAL